MGKHWLFIQISRTVRICKEKTHNGKFVDIKVHLYFKSRLVTINGIPDYIIKSIQYKQFPQCIQYKQFPQKEKREKDGDGRESG